MAEGEQPRTGRENPEGKIYPFTSQAGGDSEAGRRDKKAWYPHGDFILHTSQRCFGMLSPLCMKTAGY